MLGEVKMIPVTSQIFNLEKKKQNIFQSIWKENINSGNKDINSGNEDINSIWKKQNKTKKTHQFGEKNRPTQAKLQEINLNLF